MPSIFFPVSSISSFRLGAKQAKTSCSLFSLEAEASTLSRLLIAEISLASWATLTSYRLSPNALAEQTAALKAKNTKQLIRRILRLRIYSPDVLLVYLFLNFIGNNIAIRLYISAYLLLIRIYLNFAVLKNNLNRLILSQERH